MGTFPAEPPDDGVEVRGSRASSVIVHRVAAEAADQFLALQGGISRAAQAFPGYQATDVYPPVGGREGEWVIVLHFAEQAALQKWLDSPERAEWVAKFHNEIGEFRLKTLPSGFGTWFAGQTDEPKAMPPGWKMVMVVVLGLFPTVMILKWTVGYVGDKLGLGFAVGMLIGNACSVSILQWFVMPVLTRLFDPWLKANAPSQKNKTVAGAILILVLYAALAAFFTITDG